jgi:hypothetical protein
MMKNDSNWIEHWDEYALVPFAINGNKLMSFENEQSLKEKV